VHSRKWALAFPTEVMAAVCECGWQPPLATSPLQGPALWERVRKAHVWWGVSRDPGRQCHAGWGWDKGPGAEGAIGFKGWCQGGVWVIALRGIPRALVAGSHGVVGSPSLLLGVRFGKGSVGKGPVQRGTAMGVDVHASRGT